MRRIVSIHQPSYFPWLGLLDKIEKSDLYVILDTVQLNDNSYQNRNIFLDNQGKNHLLTVPISKKNYIDKSIKDIKISNTIWQKKHNKFIYFNYKKHPFFDEIYPSIEPIYSNKKYEYLIDLLIDTMELSFGLFDIQTKIILSSQLDGDKSLKKEDMVLDILKETEATVYLSGTGAKSYQKNDSFSSQGIELKYQEFIPPVYKQFKNSSFSSGLAYIDILFNLGKEDSSKLLRGAL